MTEVNISGGKRVCVSCGDPPVPVGDTKLQCFNCGKKMRDIDVPDETHIYVGGAGYAVWTRNGNKKHILRKESSELTICGRVRGEPVHEYTELGDSEICGNCRKELNK